MSSSRFKLPPWIAAPFPGHRILSIALFTLGPCATASEMPLTTIPVEPLEATELPTVLVRESGTSGLAGSGSWSSGLDGAPHTQPLSIVSYSVEELMALGARDQKSAFETVAAAIAPVDFQMQPTGAYRMRGFNAYVLHDGYQNFGSYGQRDTLAGVERIDFIKGPGSSLNAGALGLPPGGAIDIHARRAGEHRWLSLLAGSGRDDQRRYELELDSGDLAPVVSVGLSAAYGDGNGFFDFSQLGYRKFRPSLSLHGFGGRLTLFYEDSRREQTDHPGLPTTGTLDRSRFTIPDSRSVSDPDTPLSRSSVEAWGIDVELPLLDWLTLSGGARRADSRIDQATQYVSSNEPSYGSTWTRLSGTYRGDTEETQARARLTARVGDDTLGRWTGWIGYGGEQGPDHVELYQGVARSIDLVDPQYGPWREPLLPFSTADSAFRIRNFGGGLQWRYDDWLNAFVAGTRTHATVRNEQTSITHQLIRDRFGEQALEELAPLLDALLQNPLLQDAGLFVDRDDRYDLAARQYGLALRAWRAGSDLPQDGLWLFAGHGNGHQFRAYFASSDSPKPELSAQTEYGLRLVNADWGALQAARFRIERRNVPTLDPKSPTGFGQITTGLQSVQGYDLEVRLSPPLSFWDRFTLNGSAAWLHSRLEEDNTYPVGNALANVPARQWRLQLATDLLRGQVPLRAFATRRCRSAVQGDLANSFRVPGFCLLDAGARVEWNGLSLDVIVNNLTDTRYYEPYTYLFYGVVPGEARELRLTLGYIFGH